MKKLITPSYCSPTCEALEIKAEGFLCQSSIVDKITQGSPIDPDDVNQIF